jgi:hypothetical protein
MSQPRRSFLAEPYVVMVVYPTSSSLFSNPPLGIVDLLTRIHDQVWWHQCIDYPYREDGIAQVYCNSKLLVYPVDL